MVLSSFFCSCCIDLDLTHTDSQAQYTAKQFLLSQTDTVHPHIFIMLFVRWEEERYEDGVKWKFLEHKGPYFPPEYQPLPDNVHFYYDGELSVKV